MHWFFLSSFFKVQLSQPYIATGHTSAFMRRIFVEIRVPRFCQIFLSFALLPRPFANLHRMPLVNSVSSVLDLFHRIFASNISNTVRYDVGHKGGQIGNHQRAFDWHYEPWSWMTLNCPSSRPLQLHVKYFDNDVWNATALGRYAFHRTYFLLL